MIRNTRIAALALIVTLTILSGYMQGNLRRRWGASNAEKVAAARLVEFPKILGDWETVHEGELDDTSLKILEPLAYHVRTLKSSVSDKQVNVLLLIGQPGPIALHTPEVCVSGIGYEKLGATEKLTIVDPDNPELKGTFWCATFRSKGYDRHILREYWAWTTGGPWEAATGVRMRYGFSPYLYKIQLGCRLPAGSDPTLVDPIPGLLQSVVAESSACLVKAQHK